MNQRLAEYNARRTHQRPTGEVHTVQAMHHAKASGQPCRWCGTRHRVECHHIVHRGKLGGKHPLLHHVDNGMPLCHSCHQSHHTTTKRVPRSLLTLAELAFAVKYAGEGWLDRWYPA